MKLTKILKKMFRYLLYKIEGNNLYYLANIIPNIGFGFLFCSNLQSLFKAAPKYVVLSIKITAQSQIVVNLRIFYLII